MSEDENVRRRKCQKTKMSEDENGRKCQKTKMLEAIIHYIISIDITKRPKETTEFILSTNITKIYKKKQFYTKIKF